MDSTSAFATPRRRQRREVEIASVQPRLRPCSSFCAVSMNDFTWPVTPSSSHAIFQSVGSWTGSRQNLSVVGVGVLHETPVVAEGLDVGLPDLAQLVVGDRADRETFGELVIGEVVDGGPHHLGRVGIAS